MNYTNLQLEARLKKLTPREKEVFMLVSRGVPNKVSADRLGVSQRTIEAHRANIFKKMHVRNATELMHDLFASYL